MEFDGFQNFVSVPNHAALYPQGGFTLECWLKTTAAGTYAVLGNLSSTDGYDITINSDTHHVVFFGRFQGTTFFGISNFSPVTDGNWHHFAVTWNGATRALRAFTDGVLGETKTTAGPIVVGTLPFTIGRGGTSFPGFGPVAVDEVRLSDMVRYPSNFTPQYSYTVDSSTIAYWNFGTCDNDTTPPAITCPDDQTVAAAEGECSAVVEYETPTPTDNCPGATASCDPASGSAFPVGTTTVTCTATDASGNTASCTFTVTVDDTEPPAITCPDDQTVAAAEGECSAVVEYETPTPTDNCPGATASCDPASGSEFPTGTTTVTCMATDTGDNAASCTFTVTVHESTPPAITCPADVTVNTDAGQCTATNVVLGTAQTGDNCGVAGVVNDAPATFALGATTVTWTATDINGNVSTCQQTVTVIDNQPPSITCPGNVTVNADAGLCTASGVALGAATTSDNCAVATIVNNAPATFPVGNTTVTWTATDTSGNTSTCQQTVTVVDNQPPTITCPADATVSTDPGECNATGVVIGTAETNDNCAVAGVVNNAPTTFALGTNSVTWTVLDGSGNSNTCQQLVIVLDNQAPSITCPGTQSVPATSPTNGIVNYPDPTVSDNCSATAACVPASGSTFSIGDTTVTCTATDTAGNTSSCAFTVHVENATELVGDAISDVGELGIDEKLAKKLTKKLEGINKQIAKGKTEKACKQLAKYLEYIIKQRSKGKLTASQADALASDATAIAPALGCPEL